MMQQLHRYRQFLSKESEAETWIGINDDGYDGGVEPPSQLGVCHMRKWSELLSQRPSNLTSKWDTALGGFLHQWDLV
ncbi:hypothetical protein Y032_0031g2312 [Ancylostoma ceylanicum]|uniref:Uncharacterized protein n=1 Tax=Ancylostoma ceylanicum TaxID=53326 RepID=A0A016UPS9_9BILA|nr:hypothetical protein Y032_0031g2312 [Ancylostoma ceylanicum]